MSNNIDDPEDLIRDVISMSNKKIIKKNNNKLPDNVYKNINDTYYQNLSGYDINVHGIGNSAIESNINIKKNIQQRLTNDEINEFYGHDYSHFCHNDNILFDIKMLKNMSNDHEFEYDYRNIGHYDNIINKYLNTDLINLDRFKKILNKIFIILDSEIYKYDKKKIITYFNEWLLNNNWTITSDKIIINKFITLLKKFDNHYNLLFNKKIYYQQQKVNTTDFDVSKSSIFYDKNINESLSLKNNIKSHNYFNKDYFNTRPSYKYKNTHII